MGVRKNECERIDLGRRPNTVKGVLRRSLVTVSFCVICCPIEAHWRIAVDERDLMTPLKTHVSGASSCLFPLVEAPVMPDPGGMQLPVLDEPIDGFKTNPEKLGDFVGREHGRFERHFAPPALTREGQIFE
jgi:hypothetical protein